MVESTTYFDIYWETTIWVSKADVDNSGFRAESAASEKGGLSDSLE